MQAHFHAGIPMKRFQLKFVCFFEKRFSRTFSLINSKKLTSNNLLPV